MFEIFKKKKKVQIDLDLSQSNLIEKDFDCILSIINKLEKEHNLRCTLFVKI